MTHISQSAAKTANVAR